jgi:hypothetical protein
MENVENSNSIKIKFPKPYEFEGKTYTEIDLGGMHDLNAKDIAEIDNIFIKQNGNPLYIGLTLDYAIIVANRVTGKPIEFFEGLPAKAATALRSEVFSFFYSEE